MKGEKEARRAALNIEEAAMLTALPAHRMAGGAALKAARRGAEQMEKLTLGAERSWGGQEERKWSVPSAARTARPALNHVLGRSPKSGRRT